MCFVKLVSSEIYNDSDRVLLSHLCLLGRCVLIPDTLLINRDHPARFTRSFGGRSREGTVWFDAGAAKRRLFPYWREFGGLWEVISRSPLRWRERLQCYGLLLAWFRSLKEQLFDDLRYYPRAWLARHRSRAKQTIPHTNAAAQHRPWDDGSTATGAGSLAKPKAALIDDAINITVILCTYNRCQDLGHTLENLAASRMPSTATWEVLVVDNNSTDQTRDIVGGLLPPLSGAVSLCLRTRGLASPMP